MCLMFDANNDYAESNFNLLSTHSVFEYLSVQLKTFFSYYF